MVNAVIRGSIRPRKELPVGWKARAARKSHHLMPRLTERFSAHVVHKYQIKNAPPAHATPGALYEPVKAGDGVDDGVRKRMKEERRQRRRGK